MLQKTNQHKRPKPHYAIYRPNQQIDTAGALVIALCAGTFGFSYLVSMVPFPYSHYLPQISGYLTVLLVIGILAVRLKAAEEVPPWLAAFAGAIGLYILDVALHLSPLDASMPDWLHTAVAGAAKVVNILAAACFVKGCDPSKLRGFLLDGLTLSFGIGLTMWATYTAFFQYDPTLTNAVSILVDGACIGYGLYLFHGTCKSSPFGRMLGLVMIACGTIGFFGPLGAVGWTYVPEPAESLISLAFLGAISGTSPGHFFYDAGQRRFKVYSTFVVMVLPAVVAGFILVQDTWMEGLPVIIVAVMVSYILSQRLAGVLTIETQITSLAERSGLINAAYRDGLTGLPNRSALHERLNGEYASTPLSLLYIDLDRFKVVNDTAGHGAGDEVLRLCAQRISRVLSGEHELYRVSGDEFVALLPGRFEQLEAIGMAEKVIQEINPPFFVHGKEWFLGASIGIAHSYGQGELDSAALLRNADAAMVAAKENGRNTCYVFDQNLVDHISSQHDAEVRLRHALERGWIIPVYQPIVNLHTGRIAGFETLARWRDADGSIRSAASFIELAEKTKLVRDVDLIVLKGACQFISQFNSGLPEEEQVWITVNVSPIDLASGEVTRNIQNAIEESGINPHWLVIELIESALQSDAELARQQLMEIHDLGVGLAIDDFGTGYSSLAHLMRFPVDLLKVDKAFIRELTEDVEDPKESMAAAVLTITKALKFPAIAEGVETKEIADILRSLGYGLAQGYLYSRPLYGIQALGLRGQVLDGSVRMTIGV